MSTIAVHHGPGHAPSTPVDELVALPQLPDPPGIPAYRPVARLGGRLQGLLVGIAVLDVVGFLVARRALDSLAPSAALDAVLVAILVGVLVTGVTMLRWAHRVTANTAALGAREVPFTPASAVWWWFVPFANLVRPPQVLAAVAKASHPDYAPRSTLWRSSPALGAIWAWWGTWLAARVAGRLVLAVDDIDSFWLSTPGLVLVTALEVAAVVLAVHVVRTITGDQRHRATRLARSGLLPAELADHRRT